MSNAIDSLRYPGWEVTRLIGRGSYGEVYEIERQKYGTVEKAALKVISVPKEQTDAEEFLQSGYDMEGLSAHYRDCLSDIAREYQVMASMRGNSNVVSCDDFQVLQKEKGFGWDVYIRMELLTPLMDVLDKLCSEAQVVKLGKDIARALALCRSRSILHRDIKPQNMFVSSDGNFKLGDFGIAKFSERTSGGTKIGTYNYMAPEVFHNQAYGHQADLYSLGIVLYWLLNERCLPFCPAPPAVPSLQDLQDARARRFRGDELPAPLHGSPELKSIVLKACAFDPATRYKSADELLQSLEDLNCSEEVFSRSFARQDSSLLSRDEHAEHQPVPESRSSENQKKGHQDPENPSAEPKTKTWVLVLECFMIVVCLGVIFILYQKHFRKPALPPQEPALSQELTPDKPETEAEIVTETEQSYAESPYLGEWLRTGTNSNVKEIIIFRDQDNRISFFVLSLFGVDKEHNSTITSATIYDAPVIDNTVESEYEDSFCHKGIIRLHFSGANLEVEVEETERAGGRGGLYNAEGSYHKTSGMQLSQYLTLQSFSVFLDTEGYVGKTTITEGTYMVTMTAPLGSGSGYYIQSVHPVDLFLFPDSLIDPLQEGSTVFLFGQDRYVTKILQPGEDGAVSKDHRTLLLSNGESIAWNEFSKHWALYQNHFYRYTSLNGGSGYYDLDMWYTGEVPIYDDYYEAQHGIRSDPKDIYELYNRYKDEYESFVFIIEVKEGVILSVRLPDQNNW